MLYALNENEYITYEELSAEIGIGRSTVSRYIQELKELGVIKRVGANKKGSWVIRSESYNIME